VSGRARALSVAGGTAVLATLLLALHALDAVELPLRDRAMRLLPRRPAAATVIVAIDEASLQRLGAWPWPRATVARIVDRAREAGARGVVVDVLDPETRDGDAELAAALRRTPSVLVAAMIRGDWLLPAPPLRDAATLAHGNFELDHDGIARRVAATKQSGDRALAAVCYDAAALLRATPVPVGHVFRPGFRTAPAQVPVVSAADVVGDGGQAREPVLHGRIVFLGPTAVALGDRVLTPVSGPEPGVTVHAAATESLLRGEEIHELPPWLAGLLCGGQALLPVLSRRRTLIAALATLATMAGGVALLAANVAIPFASLLLTILISTSATALLQSRKAATDIATRLAQFREHEAESKRVLAHELKTPLASMRGLTQLLTSFDLSDAERRRVTTLLETEAGKLQSMVQGLLDLERLSLRDFEETKSIDLAALVAARVGFLRASTERELRIAPAMPAMVRADPVLVERVVDNLVSNALKYTSGPVAVAVKQRGSEALLEVEDRGEGISDADRERIFQRFFRGATAAGTQGLGLGLSLVAETARWHGGRVSVEAAAGGGSVFRVTFPLAGAYAKAGAM
jgi:signal transduction histidine kinase